MQTYLLKREQFIAQTPEKVFAFFADAANLELITPPWLRFRCRTPAPIHMEIGRRIEYQIRWHFVPMTWLSEIAEWDPPIRFTDVQVEGPYSMWRHTHSFLPKNGGTQIIDKIRYGLPLGPLGAIAHGLKVRRDLQAIFDYRALRVREIFAHEL